MAMEGRGMEKEKDIDDLPKNEANYTALTPLWFLKRAALVHPHRRSVVHGSLYYTWLQTYHRCCRLASSLSKHSVGFGSTVAVIAPNIPAMYEAHFGVPMSGAVINAVNIRLNAPTIAFLLEHSASAVIMVDQEYFKLAEEALKILKEKIQSNFKPPLLIVIRDESSECDPKNLQYALGKGAVEYEKFLEFGDPKFVWKPPQDEWHSIALGYTSGTTSSPKGVVLHHRGAYLTATSNTVVWDIREGAVYLWSLPMFHCNGWCFTWTLAAICGTSVCLRQVTAKGVYSAIANLGVTHFCAAPVVLNTIVNAPSKDTILPLPRLVHVMTAGAAPPPSVLFKMSQNGFRVTHTYGLSETYGPSTICAWKPEWDHLPAETQAKLNSRQGVPYTALEGLEVVDTQTMVPVPANGTTVGEIVFRGNMVMKGYLKNPKANSEAFANGWFHSGDLAVKHPDGYIEIKDRSKDIIISGGENISSVEVENTLYQHPMISEASVVARPDKKWGESPCAFVTLKEGVPKRDESKIAEDIMKFCRAKMPAYWVPRSVVFGPLPKTATGKVQKHLLRTKAKEMGPVNSSKL
ncbi:acetate/butyrate--CoA ligase AAE7, peroxisomal [Cynara cardunculus var. scolymus]|uniref:AMP-binding, conserved site-containing protein n=1 Tax=Cynara cardunculus var. scolymus TaxID=59895 RepID=A0A118JZC3_CYNCS|nr:acetate/butyrate--CoA ligase AAE7, peroxisomal [Cynara cardunculus var. scolymus]KVH99804.1 AMP-binding, conserved site-containing protein [Cynara cardunculus var. scolymus]